jgi:hypothetical protein
MGIPIETWKAGINEYFRMMLEVEVNMVMLPMIRGLRI